MNEPEIYAVLTLYQPWAGWVVNGDKIIETRLHDRFRSLKGKRVLIHAGQHMDISDAAVLNPYIHLRRTAASPDFTKVCQILGAIIGSAFINDFGELSGLQHSVDALIDCENTKRYGLFLKDVVKFDDPLFERGSMGIWYYDLANKEKVRKPKTLAA